MEKDLHVEFYNWMIGCDVSGSAGAGYYQANAKALLS